jgi:hypothetical protein
MRLRRLARAAIVVGRMTPELAQARAEQLASFTHFLDIPILLVIVALGALRPNDWTQFVIGIVIAVAAASLLNYFIPRLYPWGGRSPRGCLLFPCRRISQSSLIQTVLAASTRRTA